MKVFHLFILVFKVKKRRLSIEIQASVCTAWKEELL
jgi:hypothetical protein